jgi:hypothetical protein
MLQIAANVEHIDMSQDVLLHQLLVCICYRTINYIMADWSVLVPYVLGHLNPIVRTLPPGQTLADLYPVPVSLPPSPEPGSEEWDYPEPSPKPSPSIPTLLSEVYEIRDHLWTTRFVPRDCLKDVWE